MNKLGVHALVWEAGWSHDAMRARHRAELRRPATTSSRRRRSIRDRSTSTFTRRQLEAAGIGINFSMGLDAGTDISSGDKRQGGASASGGWRTRWP